MSEQLTPKIGDWVRLVHEDGAEIVGEITGAPMTPDWNGWTVKEVGAVYEDRGWSVAVILEKPLPPEGAFVKGLLHEGDDPFVGRSTGDPAFPFSVLSLSGVNGRVAGAAIKSWEVVE